MGGGVYLRRRKALLAAEQSGAALGFVDGCGWEDEGGAGLRGQLKGGKRSGPPGFAGPA